MSSLIQGISQLGKRRTMCIQSTHRTLQIKPISWGELHEWISNISCGIYLASSVLNCFEKTQNIGFYIFFRYWYDTDTWKPLQWRACSRLSYIINIIVADDLAEPCHQQPQYWPSNPGALRIWLPRAYAFSPLSKVQFPTKIRIHYELL